MIAGTTEPLAVHAGTKILQSGGTAADAAVAPVLAQIAGHGCPVLQYRCITEMPGTGGFFRKRLCW